MKPINFKEANKDLQKPSNMTDDECGPLPIFNDRGYCISCWKMSLRERIKALFIGKIWLCVLSGTTQPPVILQTETPFEREK